MASIVKKLAHATGSGHSVKIASFHVGPVGTGLMRLTWQPTPPPEETSLQVLDAALKGKSNFWNSGTFYGNPPNGDANLKLIAKYFSTRPGVSKDVVVSVKGCDTPQLGTDASPEGVQRSVSQVVGIFEPVIGEERRKAGLPIVDIFESARVDNEVPIEITVKAFKAEIEKGNIGAYALSEVSSETIRRAHKVHPVAFIELEYSLWALEAESNGVFETARELGIPIVAYSPIGRGFLTGQLRSASDIPKGDFRSMIDRFQPENFDKNLVLVDKVTEFAKKKGVTPSQLAIGWTIARGKRFGVTVIPIPGSTRVSQTEENVVAVDVSESELNQIQEILDSIKPSGGRYSDAILDHGMQLYGDTPTLEEYEKKQ